MAGRKRKAGAALTLSQRKRPTTEIVEVSSDPPEKVFKKGAARGLNEGNVLTPPLTRPSVEQIDNDEDAKLAVKISHHMTRGARNGRTDDRLKYDMKFHPMDDVTNPKRAARRRSGSRSVSAGALRIDDETSDESLPSTGEESEDDESRAGDGSSSGSDIEKLLPSRTPDARATRHSTRAVADKNVCYSSKHHPQDYALPGHQKKAKKLRRAQRRRAKADSKTLSEGFESPPPSPPPEDTEGPVVEDSESDEEIDPGLASKQRSKPRKNLRSLSDKSTSSPRKSAENDETELVGPDDLFRLLSKAGSTAFPKGDRGDRETDADSVNADKLNGMVDDAQTSSSSARKLSDYVAAKHSRPLAGPNTFASDTEEDPPEDAVSIQSRHSERPEDSAADEDDEQSDLLEDQEDNQVEHESSSPRDESEASGQEDLESRRPSQGLPDGKAIQRGSPATFPARQGGSSVGSTEPSSDESSSADTED